MMRSAARLLVAICVSAGVVAADPQSQIVYRFDPADALTPAGPLLQRRDGSLVVAAHLAKGAGVLFGIDARGRGRVIHTFTDGESAGCLLEADDGRVMGATTGGSIFALDGSDRVTVLGELPGRPAMSWLTEGSRGGFYGVAAGAGTAGLVFRLESDGKVLILHQFGTDGSEGASPIGPLVEFPDANFYGATSAGGAHGAGAIYRVTTEGELSVAHSFDPRTEGGTPSGGLLRGPGQSGFGVLAMSARSYASGAIYRWNQDGSFEILHDFAGADGMAPVGDLIRVDEVSPVVGVLLAGATRGGGPHGAGTIYALDTRRRTLTVLHALGIEDSPLTGVIQGRDGAFYAASTGGDGTPAVVFRVTR